MKIIIRFVAAFIALVAAILVALVVLLSDANRFKPHIESFAKTQGVSLQLGELGWTFFPRISLQADDVGVAPLTTPDQPIATLGQARLELAVMPLLRGDYRVNQITLANADIRLSVDKNGKGNWEALSGNSTEVATPPTEVATDAEKVGGLSLAIDRIQLRDSQLHYVDDASASRTTVSNINLSIDDANTRGEPFTLKGGLTLAQEALILQLDLNAHMSVDLDKDTLQLRDTQLRLQSKGASAAELVVNTQIDVTALTTALAYRGSFSVEPTSLKKWLAALESPVETANADALTKLAFSADIAGGLDNVSLSPLVVTVDDTQLTGSASVKSFSSPSIQLDLSGNALNADDYLAPTREEGQESEEAPTEDTPLPLAALRDIAANVNLRLTQFTIAQLQWRDVALDIQLKQGRLTTDFSAAGYEGKVAANIGVDARTDIAQLTLDIDANQIALAPLMRDLDMSENLSLEGAITANVDAQSRGATVNTLVEKLDLTATFSGAEVKLSPINLEQQFCRVVGLINQTETPERVWEAFTPLKELSGTITLKHQLVKIERLAAGVQQLLITPSGHINLATDAYDISLPFKLVQDAASNDLATSASGCVVGSNYWVQKGLELLRCRGSFATINPLSDCRPDPAMLTQLTKELALKALSDKTGINVDEQKQVIETKVEEKKEELKEKVEEKKQELFNKLTDRLQRRASSDDSASSADVGQ